MNFSLGWEMGPNKRIRGGFVLLLLRCEELNPFPQRMWGAALGGDSLLRKPVFGAVH